MVPRTAECLKRSRRNVEELMEFFPVGRFQAGDIAEEFIAVENLPHRRLKTRKLRRELWILICCLGEAHQFLAEQIVQRTLNTETIANPTSGLALLFPDLCEAARGIRDR